MPSFEHVTYNSKRVQRALKINNIEDIKLKGRLHLMDKERIHRQRITNQDIRLISLTLDYIQSSSGHSTEALAPESEDDDDEEKKSEGPCFLYGERIISRKKRRHLRPQSAFDQSGSVRASDVASTVSSAVDVIRPQSSPVKNRHTFITSLRDDVSVAGGDGYASLPSRSGASSPQPAWAEEPSDITKILLRAKENESHPKTRQSIFNRDRNASAFKAMTRTLRISSGLAKDSGPSVLQNISRSSLGSLSPVSGKIPSVNDILNQSRPAMSAKSWKSHLNRSNASPITSSSHRNFIMDSRKEASRSKSAIIQSRIKEFINYQ